LLFGREHFPAEIGEPGSHRWIDQRRHGGRVEFADDVLWRALGREKAVP
jgi:hypothetical protein